MQDHTLNTLEFDVIRTQLEEQALSTGAKRRARALVPYLNWDLLQAAQRETRDARELIERLGLPPLALMENLEASLLNCAQGGLLGPEQLSGVATFIGTCRRMQLYMKKGEEVKIELSLNGRAILDLGDLQSEIEGAIQGSGVSDSASSALRDIRRRISGAEEQVKNRLNRLLSGHKEWFSDGYVSMRGGRATLPVKAQHRSQVPGAVIDRSNTGGTLFIEPQAVRQAQDELALLRLDEENEVRRVLYALTALVLDCLEPIRANMRLMERLDFAFAKAKLALQMGAREAPVTRERAIKIVRGRHPLLEAERAVPLDFEMGGGLRGVVITGPNTGGKTVALKTIGLLSLMAQSGLQIPADEGSLISMHNLVLVDIGDGQDIKENLSTFSAHMKKVLEVLRAATPGSLVLLDELGSGTDPSEGMGLAVAVLEELSARGCLFVVTTHYPELKAFADQAEGMTNARMTFDPETFEPLYRMVLNEAGESCALMIAHRLGFPDALVERARQAAYQGGVQPQIGRRVMAPGGAPRIETYEAPREVPARALKFQRGDSVRVYPEGIIGIVSRPSDERGMIEVQLRGKKKPVPYKRLRLIAPAEQMYPDDYDFSIVFDTVSNRKARHVMEKRHDPSAVVRE